MTAREDGHPLVVWTIYRLDAGLRDFFCARPRLVWSGSEPVATDVIVANHDVDAVRRGLMSMGLKCAGRHPDARPSIVETWT